MNRKAAEAGNGNGGGKYRLTNQHYLVLVIESVWTRKNLELRWF